MWACARKCDICRNLLGFFYFFLTFSPSYVFHVRLLAVQLFSFPAGTFLPLTSRVYQPLRSTKDPEANSLFSQVLEKTNHSLWEPFPPPTGVRNNAEAARTANSCLSVGTSTGPGPVTGMREPERVRRCVQVLLVTSEVHVQPYGNIKITLHGDRYSCPSSLQW